MKNAVPSQDDLSSSPLATLSPRHLVTVALIGNPNTGKTTLFNALTGLRMRVGNYPGVTVETKKGQMTCEGRSLALPACRSLVLVVVASRARARRA